MYKVTCTGAPPRPLCTRARGTQCTCHLRSQPPGAGRGHTGERPGDQPPTSRHSSPELSGKKIGLIKSALLALASQMAKQLSVLLWNLTQMNKNGMVGKE